MNPWIVRLITLASLLSALPLRADEAATESAQRFDRGIHLVDVGDLSGALAEFERVRRLTPSSVVSYNLGLVYAELNRPVQAAQALDEALLRADTLKPAHRARLERVLSEQRARIGFVELEVNVPRGAVQIDNVEVAQLPLTGPLAVASGARVVGVVCDGYAPARKELFIAGDSHTRATLHLVAIEARLAHIFVRSAVPAADVLVDGGRVGATPLEASITVVPGTHHVELRRAGYLSTAKTLTLQDGATAELKLDLTVDAEALARDGGYLRVDASEDHATLRVDEAQPVPISAPVRVPSGEHRLQLERGGFLTEYRDVRIAPQHTTRLRVSFIPTAETRAAYLASATSRRTWSWVLFGASSALALAGGALAIVEHAALPASRAQLERVQADWERGAGGACDFTGEVTDEAGCRARLNTANQRVNDETTLRSVGFIGAGVGLAAIAVSVILLATNPDLDRYDPPKALSWQLTPMLSPHAVGVAFSAQTGPRL